MIYGNYLRNKYNNAAVKLADAEGVPCIMEYSKGKNMRNYEIYGNSVQDGTPSPATPIEVQSVGDLVTDTASEYYGKYDVPITVRGKNLLPITTHLYLDEPLRKVGDYADYIDFKNQKVIRNVFKQLLNATATYKKLNSVIRLACRNTSISQKYDTHMLSTIFNYNYGWFANTECIFHHNGTNWNYYWSVYWNRLGLTYDGTNVYRTDDTSQTPLTDSEIISTAKEWLSTLSDKDKEIYMILDTPTEESVSLPTLKTFKGTSIVSVDTSIQPSNIKTKYVIS
jgi:hypothetical protein